MPTTYSPCNDTVAEMAAELIENHHSALTSAGVKIDYAFAYNDKGAALKLHGRTCAGIARILPLKERGLGRGDVRVELDGDTWGTLGEPERRALLDHELTHFQVRVGKVDAEGRPVVKIRPHDPAFGWFEELAARHGKASYEVKQATELLREHRESYFQAEMDFDADADDSGRAAAKALKRFVTDSGATMTVSVNGEVVATM